MTRLTTFLLTIGIILTLGVAAYAGPGNIVGTPPTAFVAINGQRETIPVTIDQEQGIYLLNDGTPFVFSADGATIIVNAIGDPDPSLVYSVSAITPGGGGVTSFSFGFGPFDIVDCPEGSTIEHTFSGSISSSNADGVTITPITNPKVSTYTGIADIPAGSLDLGDAQSSPASTGTFPYPPTGIYSATQIAGPGGITSLGIVVDFDLTNTQDSVGLSGQLFCAIPEPGTVSLVAGFGMTTLGLLARRRLRR